MYLKTECNHSPELIDKEFGRVGGFRGRRRARGSRCLNRNLRHDDLKNHYAASPGFAKIIVSR